MIQKDMVRTIDIVQPQKVSSSNVSVDYNGLTIIDNTDGSTRWVVSAYLKDAFGSLHSVESAVNGSKSDISTFSKGKYIQISKINTIDNTNAPREYTISFSVLLGPDYDKDLYLPPRFSVTFCE
jgi:hypothetical protein